MLDTDRTGINVKVIGVPCSIPVVDDLADSAVGFDLIVGRSFAAVVPQISASFRREADAGIVVDYDVVDGSSPPSGEAVPADQSVFVWF